VADTSCPITGHFDMATTRGGVTFWYTKWARSSVTTSHLGEIRVLNYHKLVQLRTERRSAHNFVVANHLSHHGLHHGNRLEQCLLGTKILPWAYTSYLQWN
jgi:hypothetical protein